MKQPNLDNNLTDWSNSLANWLFILAHLILNIKDILLFDLKIFSISVSQVSSHQEVVDLKSFFFLLKHRKKVSNTCHTSAKSGCWCPTSRTSYNTCFPDNYIGTGPISLVFCISCMIHLMNRWSTSISLFWYKLDRYIILCFVESIGAKFFIIEASAQENKKEN